MDMHGTVTLKGDRIILRRYSVEDINVLYEDLGLDIKMYEFSGWNPYKTPEMTAATVEKYICSYNDAAFYGWAVESEGRLIGTVGAYDYNEAENSAELGISISRRYWNKGYGSEALDMVIKYLTEVEDIGLLKAWCAADNKGSRKAMENCGMKLKSIEKNGLAVGENVYDKLNFEYTADRD
ncbi:MAG: GNAT family N-acetyltransferase [Bacillota bacterium]|nr:GNAT family N-acetyltransferase [Bacillota bacterium]